jgi:hypothetical protein
MALWCKVQNHNGVLHLLHHRRNVKFFQIMRLMGSTSVMLESLPLLKIAVRNVALKQSAPGGRGRMKAVNVS